MSRCGPALRCESMDVRFRPIVEDDFQAVCDLVRSEEELFLFYDAARHPFTVPQVRKLVETRMDPLVMLHRGEVVGFGDFYGHRERRSIFVGNIVLDRSLRGKGLGKRLVSYMIDRAFSEHDLERVCLHVYSRNLAGLLLYHALGFRPFGMKVRRDYRGEAALLLTLGLSREAWSAR